MEKQIHSIEDIINLIDKFNIADMNIINEICANCLKATFMPIQIAGHPAPKEYYMERLQIYKKRMDENLELPIFLNANVPFDITDFYNPDTYVSDLP